jgi:hypothetical protein
METLGEDEEKENGFGISAYIESNSNIPTFYHSKRKFFSRGFFIFPVLIPLDNKINSFN